MPGPLHRFSAFVAELRHRQVVRVAGVYAVVGWLLVQVAVNTFPYLNLPVWMVTGVIALTALGFPVALVLAWAFELTPGGIQRAITRSAPPADPAAGAPHADRASVAVLPFIDLSPERDAEYFSDGITEEILNALTRVEGLRVVARTSSFAFKGKDDDVRRIARALEVGAVLEGSVRRAGDQVRITAQLIDAADGCHLLSETYDREMGDIFTLQEEISRAIAHALRIRLLDPDGAPPARGITLDPEAYQLYLKGQFLWNQRTPQSVQTALDCFDRAVERDPSYALAHAARASALAMLGEYGVLPGARAYADGEAAARRALELEEALPEAHAALGFVRTLAWEWPEVDRHFRRALELEPDHVAARHWYAVFLAAVGRVHESVAQIERAQALDPLSVRVHGAAAGLRYYAREPERVLEDCRRTLELDPENLFALTLSGMAHEQAGRLPEALAALQRAASVAAAPAPFLTAALGHVHASAGAMVEARGALQALLAGAGRGQPAPFCVAALHAALMEPDAAFDWLQRAVNEHDGWILSLMVHPWLDPLRDDARYQELIKTIRLPRSQTSLALHA